MSLVKSLRKIRYNVPYVYVYIRATYVYVFAYVFRFSFKPIHNGRSLKLIIILCFGPSILCLRVWRLSKHLRGGSPHLVMSLSALAQWTKSSSSHRRRQGCSAISIFEMELQLECWRLKLKRNRENGPSLTNERRGSLVSILSVLTETTGIDAGPQMLSTDSSFNGLDL